MALGYKNWNDTAGWQSWTLGDFVAWHKGLKDHFGDQKNSKGYLLSDDAWVKFWVASEVGSYWKSYALLATPSYWSEETAYLKNNAPVSYQISQIKNIVELGQFSPVNVVYNIGSGVADVVSDLGSATTTTAKILKYAIPALVVIGLIILVIWAYKKYAK